MEVAYRQGHEEAGFEDSCAAQFLYRGKAYARGECQHSGSSKDMYCSAV